MLFSELSEEARDVAVNSDKVVKIVTQYVQEVQDEYFDALFFCFETIGVYVDVKSYELYGSFDVEVELEDSVALALSPDGLHKETFHMFGVPKMESDGSSLGDTITELWNDKFGRIVQGTVEAFNDTVDGRIRETGSVDEAFLSDHCKETENEYLDCARDLANDVVETIQEQVEDILDNHVEELLLNNSRLQFEFDGTPSW